jgi:hypothetical protein
MGREDAVPTIARLEARVARLEELLHERSRMLRLLARGACEEDLEAISRMAAGLPLLMRSGVGLLRWRETTDLRSDDVERTMKTLWRSVAPFHGEE